MPSHLPIRAPAGYLPEVAIAFADPAGSGVLVDGGHPSPVQPTLAPATGAPLVGSLAQTGVTGPFVPDRGRAVWVTLSGRWTGSVAALRSVDGGITKRPLTIAGRP